MTGIANWVNWVPPLSSFSANFGLQKKGGGGEGFVSWEHLCRRRGQTANKSMPKHLNLSISSSCKSPATGVLIFGGAFPIPYSFPYSANLQLNNYSFKQFGVSCELGYELVALALEKRENAIAGDSLMFAFIWRLSSHWFDSQLRGDATQNKILHTLLAPKSLSNWIEWCVNLNLNLSAKP